MILTQTDEPNELVFMHYMRRYPKTYFWKKGYVTMDNFNDQLCTVKFIAYSGEFNFKNILATLCIPRLVRYMSLTMQQRWLVGMWPEVPSHVPYRQEFWLETTKPLWGTHISGFSLESDRTFVVLSVFSIINCLGGKDA